MVFRGFEVFLCLTFVAPRLPSLPEISLQFTLSNIKKSVLKFPGKKNKKKENKQKHYECIRESIGKKTKKFVDRKKKINGMKMVI